MQPQARTAPKNILAEGHGLPLASHLLALGALSLFALGVLATRALSIDTWNSGSSQIDRWVETILLLACGLLGAARLRCGERTLLAVTVLLQALCLASACIYVGPAAYAEPWRNVPLSLHCAALATGALACLVHASRLPARHVVAYVPIAFAIANFLGMALDALGDRAAAKAVSSACLFLSMALLYASVRTGGGPRALQAEDNGLRWGRHIPYLVGVAVLSSIYGMLVQLGSGSSDLSLTSQSVLLARSAGLLGLAVLCWFRRGAWITERTFVAFVPVVSTLVLALPMANQFDSLAYQMLFRVASVVFQAMVWCFSLSIARRHEGSAMAVIGIVTGCQHLFMLVGRQVGANLLDEHTDLARIALGMVWLLGIGLFVWHQTNARRQNGSEASGASAAGTTVPAPPHDPVHAAAQLWALSPREEEVVRLLAAGDSRSAIASAMDVTEETVKTYLRRIYRKAGVHSKQELTRSLFTDSPSDPGACTGQPGT